MTVWMRPSLFDTFDARFQFIFREVDETENIPKNGIRNWKKSNICPIVHRLFWQLWTLTSAIRRLCSLWYLHIQIMRAQFSVWFGGVSSFSNYRSRKLKLNYGKSISHMLGIPFFDCRCRRRALVRFVWFDRCLSDNRFVKEELCASGENHSKQHSPCIIWMRGAIGYVCSMVCWGVSLSEAARTHMPQKTMPQKNENKEKKIT